MEWVVIRGEKPPPDWLWRASPRASPRPRKSSNGTPDAPWQTRSRRRIDGSSRRRRKNRVFKAWGVLLALTIPHNTKVNKNSLLLKLEHSLSPYVAFGIMPLFAFANAGVSLEGLTFATLLNPVPLGIVLGLFFGKQIGVFVLSYLSVKLKIADKPNNSTWPAFYAVSILTGIGFTMSLFVGNLAFANNMQYIDGVKIGVLAGSLLSTVFGYVLLLLFSKK